MHTKKSPRTMRGTYVTIPSYETLTPTEKETVDSGGPYPVYVADHLPEHEMFLDYLIDASLNDWARNSGASR